MKNKSNIAPHHLRQYLLRIIKDFGQKHGLTVYESIGILELVKLDLVEMLKRAQESPDHE